MDVRVAIEGYRFGDSKELLADFHMHRLLILPARGSAVEFIILCARTGSVPRLHTAEEGR